MKLKTKQAALDIAVCVSLILSILLSSFCSLESTCSQIKENVLRLHIIANSDSEEDQSLKLKVRDAVLEAGGGILSSADNLSEAVEISENEKKYLEETAERVIRENGFDYGAKIEIGKSRFPTREYGDVTLPAGEYTAVRVILGEGEGHNWWCVMFPPMCLSAAGDSREIDDVLSGKAADFVRGGKKYEVKFKIVEWYEKIKAEIRDEFQT